MKKSHKKYTPKALMEKMHGKITGKKKAAVIPVEEEEEEEVVVTGLKKGGKVQRKNARLDERLGERRGPERDFTQSMKSRRDESRGARGGKAASDKAKRGAGIVARSRPWANRA